MMYHQPTANPGLGGPYLYQWNDDRCNMKHNYICKYEPGRKHCKAGGADCMCVLAYVVASLTFATWAFLVFLQ